MSRTKKDQAKHNMKRKGHKELSAYERLVANRWWNWMKPGQLRYYERMARRRLRRAQLAAIKKGEDVSLTDKTGDQSWNVY